MSRFIRLLVLLAVAAPARTTPLGAQSDSIDAFIRVQMREQNIPGLALAVMRDGRIIKAQGYGVADRARATPVTEHTVFKIASVSKQFIATGVMLLVQDGRLRLDDPIGTHIQGTPSSWRGITIRHLLSHTSGLVREAPAADFAKAQPDIDVIRSAYGTPLLFSPGQRHLYSNVGYFILGEIITRVSGRPWYELIAERVFRPSGMRSTGPTNTRDSLGPRAVGYVDNDRLSLAPVWVSLRPSGAFLSTVVDMARWDSVLYTPGILADSTRRMMWEPARLTDGTTYPYGFGWQLGSVAGHRMVFHGGGGPGARAGFARFVDQRLSVILLMNLDDVDLDTILQGVARLYLPAREH